MDGKSLLSLCLLRHPHLHRTHLRGWYRLAVLTTSVAEVKLDKKGLPLIKPTQGKALVYFIHDSGGAPSIGYPTTKMGVDGAWVGANHNDSYFYISVNPGEHHVCAGLPTSLYEDRTELAHFSAEAGKVYYYRTRRFVDSRP